MKEVAKEKGEPGRIFITRPTEIGAHVVHVDPQIDDYLIVSVN